jgi:hypothetical protein
MKKALTTKGTKEHEEEFSGLEEESIWRRSR